MKIIKLSAIPSTNTFLKELSRERFVNNYTVVVAKHQTAGKGQRGAGWQTESGKNLTFSVLCDASAFKTDLFLLNYLVSIAIVKVLENHINTRVAIKWPNDILADNKKIAGILIENRFLASGNVQSIIGIGLNVNQKEFEDLPYASSLSKIAVEEFALLPLLKEMVRSIEYYLENLKSEAEIKSLYYSYLFGFEKKILFATKSKQFYGIIKGVSQNGLLQVENDFAEIEEFDIKEIQVVFNSNNSKDLVKTC